MTAASETYDFTIGAIRATGYLPALKLVIGGLCLTVTVLGLVTLLHPLGPADPVGRTIQFAVSVSAVPVGLAWIFGRWPSYRMAIGFVVWGDVCLGIASALYRTPEARVVTVIDMAVIGVFVAFLLGPWVLAAHSAAVAALLVGFAIHAHTAAGMSWFDLYPFMAPAFMTVVLLPVLIQTIIEGGRRTIRSTFRHSIRDPMTGLFNRRGMYVNAKRLVKQRPAVTVVAMIDLDGFKKLNDRWGHERGDDILRAVAAALQSAIRRDDVVARAGGDEFVVIAALSRTEDLTPFAERLRAALHTVTGTVHASIGIAWTRNPPVGRELVDALLRAADQAMYEAKHLGGRRVITVEAND